MAMPTRRIVRRRKDAAGLAPHIRIFIARVRLDSIDTSSDDEDEASGGTHGASSAAQTDRPLDVDEGHERMLRERRRRHFTRLCIEQLYRFEES